MSDEQLEITRETVRLIDAGELDGMRAYLHPDIALWAPRGWPEPGPMEGPDAVVRQYERLNADYAERRTEVLELTDHVTDSGEWVLGGIVWHTRGRASGIETAAELWFTNHFRDGKIVEIRFFWSRDEAVAAAGFEG